MVQYGRKHTGDQQGHGQVDERLSQFEPEVRPTASGGDQPPRGKSSRATRAINQTRIFDIG